MITKTSPYNSRDAVRIDFGDSEYGLDRLDISGDLYPSNLKHIVLEGETLQNISFKYYRDSGRWGDIAAINDIIDPLSIEKGDVLIIPL